MIYLKNITRTQSLMIPRSEGTTLLPVSEASGDYKTTYTSAEIDARIAAIRNEKLDKDSLRRENWDFTLDDGSVVEKEVAIWKGESSQQ